MQKGADRRASPRVPAKVPVLVEGVDVNHKPVREETHTLLVNHAGALVALAAWFQLNDHIRLTNQTNGNRVHCRIAWRAAEQINLRWSYGVALLEPREDFWGVPL